MASKIPTAILRNLGRPTLRQTCPTTRWSSSICLRMPPRANYSSEAPSVSPLLAKIKGDLKTSMRNKDATRLAVVRSVLAATLNASKTAKPVETDVQLVALLRKLSKMSQDSSSEFREAGREDLVEKEEAQARILDEYIASSGFESIGDAQLREIMTATQEELDGKGGVKELMVKLFAPGGPLYGKDVSRADVAKMAKEPESITIPLAIYREGAGSPSTED
ncbi:Yqey-like protein-domain-containing protein [Podospora didyma]|uniref:Altered inheritance of mitochondria protein 41 n=1 Tax=Podospora didyma TaxID=330526 RepID=A0AAE0NZ11_9PEZI|nr:Yqey-like protein-domain-containing protein [Podospora didyma]